MQIFSCSQYLSGLLPKDVLNKRKKIRLLCFVREILFAAEAVDTFACLRSYHIAVFNCNEVDMVRHAVAFVRLLRVSLTVSSTNTTTERK